jgi:hypothetical protein
VDEDVLVEVGVVRHEVVGFAAEDHETAVIGYRRVHTLAVCLQARRVDAHPFRQMGLPVVHEHIPA